MQLDVTAVFLPVPEGGYVAWAEEVPGANTQGETLEEARENLVDAVRLMIEANRDFAPREVDPATLIREPMSITIPDPEPR